MMSLLPPPTPGAYVPRGLGCYDLCKYILRSYIICVEVSGYALLPRPAKTIYMEYGYVIYIHIDTSYSHTTRTLECGFSIYISERVYSGIRENWLQNAFKTYLYIIEYRYTHRYALYLRSLMYLYSYISTCYPWSIRLTGGPETSDSMIIILNRRI